MNPFTRKPFFNEVAFFHVPSKTMFCSDVWWNYPEGPCPNFAAATSKGLRNEVSGLVLTGGVHECSKVPVQASALPPVPVPGGTKLWKFGMDR